jgi:hypothetical protein
MPIVPVFPPSGGGSPPTPPTPGIPQWLDMPTKVIYIATVPSPDPGAFTWDEPTNGTGPYTYEGYVLGGNPIAAQWNFFDYTNRTIRLTRPAPMTADGSQPMFIRIRAYDSVGNFGDQYIMVLYANTGASEVTILPETVIEEDDPAVSFTFPPHFPGWIGENSTAAWSYTIGSGLISPSPMKDTTTARYQGPFTIDPAPGGALFITTRQRPSDGGGGRQIVIKSVRRKRAPLMTTTNAPWQKVIDYDLEDIGTQSPTAFTMPLTGLQTTRTQWTQPGFGTDAFTTNTQLVSAGTSTTEATGINATGAYVQLADTVASNRAVRMQFIPRISVSHNSPDAVVPNALRANCVSMADDILIRMLVRVTMSGQGSTLIVGCPDNNGASVRIAMGVVQIGSVVRTNQIQFQMQHGSTYRSSGQLFTTEFNGLEFGYDLFASGANRRTVIYAWPGDFPTLGVPAPYGNLTHWELEGYSEQSSASTPHNVMTGGSSTGIYRSSDWRSFQMAVPEIRMEARLGGTVGSIDARITRFVIEHRPRMLGPKD